MNSYDIDCKVQCRDETHIHDFMITLISQCYLILRGYICTKQHTHTKIRVEQFSYNRGLYENFLPKFFHVNFLPRTKVKQIMVCTMAAVMDANTHANFCVHVVLILNLRTM